MDGPGSTTHLPSGAPAPEPSSDERADLLSGGDPWAIRRTEPQLSVRTWLALRIGLGAATGGACVAAQATRETGSLLAGATLLAIAVTTAVALVAGRALVRGRPRQVLALVGLGAVAVAGAALLRTVVGGRQYVLTVICTTLVTLAFPHRPIDRAGARNRPAPFVIPLVVAAQVSWYRLAPQPATAVLVAVAAVLLVVDARRPRVLRPAEDGVIRALVGLAVAVGTAVLFVVAALVLYLPAAIIRLFRAAFGRRGTRPEVWRTSSSTAEDHRRDADRPFTSTAAPIRQRRHRSSIAIVLVALVGAGLAVEGRTNRGGGTDLPTFVDARPVPVDPTVAPGSTGSTAPEAPPSGGGGLFPEDGGTPYSRRAAYLGVPWADLLQATELGGPPSPEAPSTATPTGDRTTTAPPACRCDPVRVWFSGGSAAFGIGQRDDQTIASYLVQLAASDGIALEVTNIARSGSVMADEVAAIEERLDDGAAPDLVVFHNGFNDALLDVARAFAVTVEPDFDGDPVRAIELLKANLPAFLTYEGDRSASDRTIERYDRLADQVVALLEERGAATAFYFQPDALGSPLAVSWLAEGTGLDPDELVATALGEALHQVEEGLAPRVEPLRSLFSSYPAPVFLDIVHHSEAGAALIAQAIYADLRPTLESLGS